LKTLRNVHYSVLEYRPDPSQPKQSRVPLGLVIEVEYNREWLVIGIRARSFLTPEELAAIDGIGRELLREPIQFLKNEIESLLYQPRRPNEVLALLARKHEWSIHVSRPSKRDIKVPAGMSSREAVDYALNDLFSRVVLGAGPAPVRAPKRTASAGAIPPARWSEGRLFEAAREARAG